MSDRLDRNARDVLSEVMALAWCGHAARYRASMLRLIDAIEKAGYRIIVPPQAPDSS